MERMLLRSHTASQVILPPSQYRLVLRNACTSSLFGTR